MLYPSSARTLTGPSRFAAGSVASFAGAHRGPGGARFNRFLCGFTLTTSSPPGAAPHCWCWPIVAGELAGPPASLRLSGAGNMQIAAQVAGNGSLGFTGLSASFTVSAPLAGHGSMQFAGNPAPLQAAAAVAGHGTMALSATGALRVSAPLSGNGIMQFVGTPAPIKGSAGIAGSWGGASPLAQEVAAEVLSAMNATPPAVDVRKVNGVTVDGSGTEGDHWGPA